MHDLKPRPLIYDSRTCDKFVVRLPDGMRDMLADTASANNRSMNAEFVTATWWWMERQALLESMLEATHRELQRLQSLQEADVGKTLGMLAQRHPETRAIIQTLKEMIGET